MTDLQKPSLQGGSTTGWGKGRGTCPSGPFIIGKGSMAPGHHLMLCVLTSVCCWQSSHLRCPEHLRP